jgi:hypothetical protein
MKRERCVALLRTVLSALVVLISLSVPALAASDGVTKYRALLIGNSVYKKLNNLSSCAYDLVAMRMALQSGTITYDKVVSKPNLTNDGIASAVNDIAKWGADDDDVTVFYYTGHGQSNGLAGVDCGASTTGVYTFSQLQSMLSNVPGRIIVLLDACESGGLINKSASAGDFTDNAVAAFSGASSGVAAKAITSGTKFHVIASSSKSEDSFAIDSVMGSYGVATSALCEAMGWAHSGTDAGGTLLTDLEGDANGDGTVTIAEAYAYARDAAKSMLSHHGVTQNMQVYPVNSAQTLISRSSSGATTPAAEPVAKLQDVKTMNLAKVVLAPGQKIKLDSGLTDAYWSWDKPSYVSVSGDGWVTTGKKYLTSSYATIMAQSGGNYTICKVKVLPKQYVVSKVQLKYKKISLQQNKVYTMPYKVSPSSARYKQLKWTSSNEAVAKVSSTGRIEAVGKSGTAIIRATSTSGVFAECVVTAIPAKPSSVSLSAKKKTLLPGQSFTLTAAVLPDIAEDKSVKWKSSKTSIATVADGVVTANSNGKYGKAVITATTSNGKKATCVVTVTKNQSIPRTKPKGTAGRLTSSAHKIYYSGDTLVIEMFFYNRTGYTQRVPSPNPGLVVIRLADKRILTGQYEVANTKLVRPGRYVTGKIKMRLADYPQLKGLNLLGADAWWEAIN